MELNSPGHRKEKREPFNRYTNVLYYRAVGNIAPHAAEHGTKFTRTQKRKARAFL
jgi:hypothetical protein